MSDYDPQISPAGRRQAVSVARRTRRLRRRAAGVAVFLAAVAAVCAVVAASLHVRLPFGLSGHTTTVSHTTDGAAKKHRKRPVNAAPRASATKLATLLAPASRVAVAPFGTSGALFMGGFDAAGAATDALESFDGTAAVQAVGTLPVANASAVAVALGTATYLLGGAVSSIYQVSQTGESIVGDLPNATADAAVAAVDGTAYVIGGYNGAAELNTIVAFTPGSAPHVVATLPAPLRLSTAAVIGGEIYIIGGESNGVATSRVYRFDPASTTLTRFTRLPAAPL